MSLNTKRFLSLPKVLINEIIAYVLNADALKMLRGEEFDMMGFMRDHGGTQLMSNLTIDMLENGNPIHYIGACSDYKNFINGLKILLSSGFSLHTKTMEVAVMNKLLDNIEYLYDLRCPMNSQSFLAAICPDYDWCILKSLYEHKCPWNDHAFEKAAYLNDIKLVTWLIERNCPMSSNAYIAAITYKNMDLLTLLYENDCPRGFYEFAVAARKGNFKIMKWMYERKFPMSCVLFTEAAGYGNVTILDWLYKVGCPVNENRALIRAAEKIALRSIRWFYKHKWLFSESMFNELMSFANIKVIKLIRRLDQALPLSAKTFNAAVDSKSLEKMEWLLSQDPSCPWADTIYQRAIATRDYDVINFVFNHCSPHCAMLTEFP